MILMRDWADLRCRTSAVPAAGRLGFNAWGAPLAGVYKHCGVMIWWRAASWNSNAAPDIGAPMINEGGAIHVTGRAQSSSRSSACSIRIANRRCRASVSRPYCAPIWVCASAVARSGVVQR